MDKIIEVNAVGKAISMDIFHRRTAHLRGGNPLFHKELDRIRSLLKPVVIPQNVGDPGGLNDNHGCEARGI